MLKVSVRGVISDHLGQMQIWTVTELWKLHLKIKFGRRESKSDYFCSSSRIVNLLRWPNKMHLKPLWRLYSTQCNELDGNYPKSFIHVLIPGTFACLFENSFFFFFFFEVIKLRTLIREAHLELSRWTLKAITCPCKINTQRRRHPTKEEVVAMWPQGQRLEWYDHKSKNAAVSRSWKSKNKTSPWAPEEV